MVDEHFGINIVEFMVSLNHTRYLFICNILLLQAAGVIPVTHASGGPLTDIVVHYNGEPTGTKTCLHRKDENPYPNQVITRQRLKALQPHYTQR